VRFEFSDLQDGVYFIDFAEEFDAVELKTDQLAKYAAEAMGIKE